MGPNRARRTQFLFNVWVTKYHAYHSSKHQERPMLGIVAIFSYPFLLGIGCQIGGCRPFEKYGCPIDSCHPNQQDGTWKHVTTQPNMKIHMRIHIYIYIYIYPYISIALQPKNCRYFPSSQASTCMWPMQPGGWLTCQRSKSYEDLHLNFLLNSFLSRFVQGWEIWDKPINCVDIYNIVI